MNTPIKTGVMLCGHGSRDPEAVAEFSALAQRLGERLPEFVVESGFLEFATPVIGEGFAKLKQAGVGRILAVPGMLFAAGHVKNDVPSEVNEFALANPEISVCYGRELGIDPKILGASAERIEMAEASAKKKTARADTLLLVVGRGTNDPDSNSNISKIARMLGEGLGFGWAEAAYSGVTTPLVDAALERVTRLGFSRIIVFPYFLFTGVLVKRIYAWTDAAARKYGHIEFLKAGYLNDHPLVVETFAERALGILEGDVAMNCQLCKYRERIVGFETDCGAPQVGHHHHVRGVGVDDHDHHHHHHLHGKGS